MKATFTGKSIAASLLCLACLLFLSSPSAKAQAQDNVANLATSDNGPSANDNNNPPALVARISVIEGSVSLQPGGTGDWGAAALNRPVTIGDKIWVDQNARAELQAGEESFHLGGMTALSFLNLDQNIIQARLAEGAINFRVREMHQGDTYEVDTPNLAFTVREAGAFRINVSENGDFTRVIAIRGQGEIAAGGQTYALQPGQSADVSGTDNNVKVVTAAAPGPDQLDRWAQERDLKEDNSTSAQYVNRDVVGYSDLDDYGTWKQEPDVGSVWVPNSVPVGWAPYSYGNWNWVGPWGWSWVDYAPWGFAPYHYGRWNYYGGYWGWCPGPIFARPCYGPAFVGFLGGFGVGFGVGFGWGGGYGWFPLGWGEPYRPWYRCGPGYWHNVNVNNTYIHNGTTINGNNFRNFNYRYAHNPNAVTTASHNTFVNGQAVNRSAAHLTEASLRGAHVTNGIGATPTHASYLGASATHGRVATPPSSVQNRSVMARTAPAAGASHLPVHTMNSPTLHSGNAPRSSGSPAGRPASNSQGMSANRQSQLSANRPPSTMTPGSRPSTTRNNSARSNGSARTWNAQGNTTDSGRAPQGFGSGNRPTTPPQTTRMNSSDRPPWARSGATSNSAPAAPRNSGNRPPTSNMNGNRSYAPPAYNGNRGYSAPRSYNAPSYNGNRGYSAPRAYSAPAPRSYSAPGGGYSAPHVSSGGGYHGGGGSAPHSGGGGGGGSHGHH